MPNRVFRQQAAAAGSAQGYLPAILHRIRGQTHAGLCRYQQGIGDVGRACRCQIAERDAHGRQAQDHQQRRGGAVRRQCRDEPGHLESPGGRRRAESQPSRPPKTRSVPASPPTRNDLHDEVLRFAPIVRVLPRPYLRSRCHGRRRSPCAGRDVGRAQCDAGLFAKPRSADSDRGGIARDARQEKGSHLRRQCEGRAGRHHHDVENAGGVL